MLNLLFVLRKLPETLETSNSQRTSETKGFLSWFKPLENKKVWKVIWSYFFFLMSFSGMEFTLTFLAAERLSYTPMDNGLMFVFIGFMIAMTQGGYVRRKANQVGEKKMALMGLIILIPGLIITSVSYHSWSLFFSLIFLSVGSAMVIPCLSALVSIFTPASSQGHGLGVFRSLGALARVIGPIIFGVSYWWLGATKSYLIGAFVILIPLAILSKVDQSSRETA